MTERPPISYLDTVTAIGVLSAELASRADAWNGNAPEWFPEPPEWLKLWDAAVAEVPSPAPVEVSTIDPPQPRRSKAV